LWKHLRGASWRNARAADEELEETSCGQQLRMIELVAMMIDASRHKDSTLLCEDFGSADFRKLA
jgi:hypothetical protein